MSEAGWRTFLAADGVEDWVVLHGGATAVFPVTTLAEAARLAEECAGGRPPADTLTEMWSQVAHAAGRPVPAALGPGKPGPHLTEPWFCCAEPTLSQLQLVGRG